MPLHRLIEHIRERARIDRYRILKRFHHRAHDHDFWAFRRDAVARGVAVGFFFGILVPVAQFIFAIIAAIVLRANVLVAAGSTLITNPFILPFIYYFAYRIGYVITGRDAKLSADVEALEEAAESALDVADWLPTLLDWASSIGFPLLVGILCLAVTAALAGYGLVHLIWLSAGSISRTRAARRSRR